ncbi:MAG: T9SS type A sorting domain-containing protein, partial [Candidatus Marinimicrobia bacterium]|nr:T9SS type A sorting domain-containing protein [Candidatus Neomarinimicrobiota bacterium]
SIFPGTLYNYGVRISNEYGVSDEGTDIGFTIPNGKIAGKVFTPGPIPGAPWTPAGNPVADVEVSLAPIRGKAVQLDGTNDYISVDADFAAATNNAFTLEFWYYIDPPAENATIIDWGDRLRVYQTSTHVKADIAGFIVQDDLPAEETWNHVAVVYDGEHLKLYQNSTIEDSIGYTNSLPTPGKLRFGKKRDNTEYFDGNLDDIRVWQSVRTADDIQRNNSRALFGDEPGLLGYWKFDENQDVVSFDVSEPRENAELMGGATWSSNFAQILLSAYTDEQGKYEIRGVWYDASTETGTQYTVMPYKEAHEFFSPASESVTLTRTEPTALDVKFLDESLFSVSGGITYNGTNCPVEGAEILLDSVSTRPETYTNAYGDWSLDLEPGKSGQISVRFGGHFEYDTTVVGEQTTIDTNYVDGHTFLLGNSEQGYSVVNIEQDIAAVDFTNAHTETLKLWVGGGECLYPIGPVTVTVATSPSCYSIVDTLSSGPDSLVISDLPPLDFVVSVASEHADISFQSQTTSLRNKSQDMIFIYKAPLDVEFVNPPWDTDCPVVHQFQKDSVQVFVFEAYGGYTLNGEYVPENKCPVELFSIQAFDDWAGINTELVEVEAPEGLLWYHYQPKEPKLVDPYQKQLTIRIQDPPGREKTTSQWAYITGRAVTEGTDFVSRPAKTDKLPFFVLRDPPGDGSYSYLEETQTVTRTFSFIEGYEEDDNASIYASLGLDLDVSVGFDIPFGPSISFGTSVDVVADFTGAWGKTIEVLDDTTTRLSFTTTEQYRTSDDELIVGDGADIFVGAGLNVTYSRMVDLSVENCEVQLDTSHGLSDITGFHSFYVYSDYHIRNNLIPDLEELYWNENSTPEDTAAFGESIRYWTNLLTMNDSAKANAVFTDAVSNTGESLTNISWDALSSYDYSTQNDSSISTSHDISIREYSETNEELGLLVAGVGVVGGITDDWADITNTSTGETETYSTTMGFHFADNDPGDAFTVDIKRDLVWGMPVFELVAGQTSRPWEKGTFKRQWADLSVDPLVLVDVEPDETAVFTLGLGNLSETGETWPYTLIALNETNPDGAILRVNGEPLAGNGLDFALPVGASTEATLTLERGPEAYHYEGISLRLAPPGEVEIADALGVDPQNADWAEISVHFITPCSPIELTQASGNPGWTVNIADSNEVNFTFSGYDSTDTELEYLVLEYTRAGENNWIEIDSSRFTRDTVVTAGQDFLVATWEVSNLDDGNYNLRAKSQCRLREGYSDILAGTIDRTRPEMLGVAEPADGVLNMNDQVQITFTEEIDCEALHANSAELYFALSDAEVASEITCDGNSIIISPATSVDNREIENQRLRAEVHFIRDLAENTMVVDTLAWEFVVNRNPVVWNQNSTEVIAFTDTINEFSVRLNNIGATAQPFNLTGLAPWLMVTPNQGEINPGGSFDIHFTIDPNLDVGEYTNTLFAECPEGDEPFVVRVIAMCPYPDWAFSPFDYEFSMTVTAEVLVQGMPSEDEYDRVGAFIDGEPRGLGHVTYVPEIDSYRAYLTVYSNTFSSDMVTFHIWDRTGCEEFWEVDTTLVFQDDATFGSPLEPFALNATGIVAQELAFPAGFKWFSVNIENESGDFNAALAGLSPEEGDRMIGQNAFAQFQASTQTWVGPLTDSLAGTGLETGSMYVADLTEMDELDYVGRRVVADTTTIPLVPEWNWLGYLPNRNMNVNIALNSLNPDAGDIIKDQVSFAQYVADLGWIGNLTRMFPGSGYKLRLTSTDTLRYPSDEGTSGSGGPSLARIVNLTPEFPEDSLPDVHWLVENPYQYQHSMTMTAVVLDEATMLSDPYDMVAAFIGNEVRGTARPLHVPGIDEPRLFLSIQGNAGEQFPVELRIWDNDKERTYRTVETFAFTPDAHQGTVTDPVTLNQTWLGLGDPDFIPETYMLSQNYPNPFNPTTIIGFGLPEQSRVVLRIYNILGQEVKTLVNGDQMPGYYRLVWDGTDKFGQVQASGVYIVRMQTKEYTKIRKMVLIR